MNDTLKPHPKVEQVIVSLPACEFDPKASGPV